MCCEYGPLRRVDDAHEIECGRFVPQLTGCRSEFQQAALSA